MSQNFIKMIVFAETKTAYYPLAIQKLSKIWLVGKAQQYPNLTETLTETL